jgi:hypothetical protein
VVCLDVIADILPIPAQRALYAEDERPMGPLGREGRRWPIPTRLVGRARRWVISEAQVRRRGTAACALEAVAFCVDVRKRGNDGGEGDKARPCTVDRSWAAVKSQG